MLSEKYICYLAVFAIFFIIILCYLWYRFDPYKKQRIMQNHDKIMQTRRESEKYLMSATSLAVGLPEVLLLAENALIEAERKRETVSSAEFCRLINKSILHLNKFVDNISSIIDYSRQYSEAIEQSRQLGDKKLKNKFYNIIAELMNVNFNYSSLFYKLSGLIKVSSRDYSFVQACDNYQITLNKLSMVIHSTMINQCNANGDGIEIAKLLKEKCFK